MNEQTFPFADLLTLYAYGTIEPVAPIKGGFSDAKVWLVRVIPKRGGDYAGLAYAKFGGQLDIEDEHQRHQKARQRIDRLARSKPDATQKAPAFIPEPLDPFGPDANGYSCILYQPAHSSIQTVDLREAVENQYHGVAAPLQNLLETLKGYWHDPADFTDKPEPIPEYLKRLMNVGSRKGARFNNLPKRLRELGMAGADTQLLNFQPGEHTVLPNPFAFLLRPDLWKGVKPVIAPCAPMHGDLHGRNLICQRLELKNQQPLSALVDGLPWLIDFAAYEDEGVAFFDLAYLELDLLLRALPPSGDNEARWMAWRDLTSHLASDILPTGDPIPNAMPAWTLIRPLREHLSQIIQGAQGEGIPEQYKRAWWLAACAVGALFARRAEGMTYYERVACLLYGAHALNRALNASWQSGKEAQIYGIERGWDIETDGSPFPGLDVFDADRAKVFFGREGEIQALLEPILNTHRHFFAVLGASGSGKSSLIRAGVLPRLPVDWKRIVFTPGGIAGQVGNDPFVELSNTLVQAFPDTLRPLAKALPKQLATAPDRALELILERLHSEVPLVWFIDQFEELFTVVQEGLKAPFAALLNSALGQPQIRVIVTMRSDFYKDLTRVPGLKDLFSDHTLLDDPTPSALREMIERPVARARIKVETGLIDQIMIDADPARNQGTLALVAYALKRLYDLNPHHLTSAHYEQIGKVNGAINTVAEDAYALLEPEVQGALPHVFRELVNVEEEDGPATRKRARKEWFPIESEAGRFIDKFADPYTRLLRTYEREGSAWIEVSHERLLTAWTRLKEWIDGQRGNFAAEKDFKRRARRWKESGFKRKLLPNQTEIDFFRSALEGLGRDPARLEEHERRFLRAEWEWLAEELHLPQTPNQRRLEIGNILSQYESDPRPGAGILVLSGSESKRTVPDFAHPDYWCHVPAGKFRYQGEENETKEDFWIGKYLITYRQYRCFLDDPDGYANPAWWEKLHAAGQTQQQAGARTQFWIGHNRPADNVSWYDAMAFCEWLNALTPYPPLPTAAARLGEGVKYVIRLPLELEWEKAAAWEQEKQHAREWSFGDTFDAGKCNIDQTGFGQTCAVGLFPHAPSPCGALDMSGNVWEWCLNEYQSGKVNIGSKESRGLRGGSWDLDDGWARAAARNDLDPPNRNYYHDLGFRVVVAPVSL